MKRFIYKEKGGKRDNFTKPDLDAAMRRLQHKHGIETLTGGNAIGVWACWGMRREYRGTLIDLSEAKETRPSEREKGE